MTAPIKIEKTIEYPKDMPSIFTKNKSSTIISVFILDNIKKKEISRINMMK